MSPTDTPRVWLHGEIGTPPFGPAARIEAGVLLRKLQKGEKLSLPHSRPMPSIGERCHEPRIRDREKNWRIVYRLDPDAIVIAEVFTRTAAQTPGSVVDTCKRRFRRRTDGRMTMDRTKRERLGKAGWKVGSEGEFLGLSEEETAFGEMKLALGEALRERRIARGLSQTELAKRLGSSQSRVAKMEASDPSVSVDLLLRGLLAAGATRKEIAGAIAPTRKTAA